MEEGRGGKRSGGEPPSLPHTNHGNLAVERKGGGMSRSLFVQSSRSLIRLRLVRRSEHRQPQKRKRLRGGDRVDSNWGREGEREGKAERGDDDDDDVCLEHSAAQLHKTRLDGEEEKHERMRGKGYISSLHSLPDACGLMNDGSAC